jgi:hypothetical protein
MITELLSTQEVAQTGFTHKFTVDHNDLTAAATTQTIILTGLTRGMVITNAAFNLVTPFDGGATTELTLEVGWDTVGADPNGLIEAASVHLDATEILVGDATGEAFATKRTGRPVVAAQNATALFTATGANVSVLDAGEVDIFLAIADLSGL